MDYEQIQINKLRRYLFIGIPATIAFTFLFVNILEDHSPIFNILTLILTVLWLVGFVMILKLFYLQIKRWFD